jgi:hypothetical protein
LDRASAAGVKATIAFRTAEKFGILDIIDPRETRAILCDWIEDAWITAPLHHSQTTV